MVTCKACEAEGNPNTFKAITHRHLKINHDMTLDEYIMRWPDAPTRDQRMVEELPEVGEDCQALIGNLRPIEQQYIAARLKCPTKEAAARAVGMSPTSVYNWRTKPLIEAIIGYLQVEPVIRGMTMLAQAVPGAAQNVIDLQYSHDDRVALSASKDILERAGVTAKKSEPTIDITIFREMPTEQLDVEIEKMLALEVQGREVSE